MQCVHACASCMRMLCARRACVRFARGAHRASNSTPDKSISLSSNRVGSAGVQALAGAIASGSLAKLETLNLCTNRIGDDGMQALATAVASGALASLKTLVVGADAKTAALKAACESRGISLY